jgi:hypothetical protein
MRLHGFKNNRILAIIVIVFLLVTIYFSLGLKNNPLASGPRISIDEYYWKRSLPYSEVAEDNIPGIIKAADNLIAEEIGREFFQKYIKYYPYQSRISNDGNIYYLHYIVTIPEKGINYKTTTHPVEIELAIRKDLTLVKPIHLPDCTNLNKCLDYADRAKAVEVITADMKALGYQAPEILLDWNFESWHMRYDVPHEKMPNCEFNKGGDISIYFNAAENKIVKREEHCDFPFVGI